MFIDGDVPHMLRHYFAEPPRKDRAWQKFRYEMLDKKHDILKAVDYSTRCDQKFWSAQLEFIERHGAVGGYAVPIRDFSHCPVRMDHDAQLLEGFCRTLIPSLVVLADECEDKRRKNIERESSRTIMQMLISAMAFSTALTADRLQLEAAIIHKFEGDHNDSALVCNTIAECIESTRVLFLSGAILAADNGDIIMGAVLRQFKLLVPVYGRSNATVLSMDGFEDWAPSILEEVQRDVRTIHVLLKNSIDPVKFLESNLQVFSASRWLIVEEMAEQTDRDKRRKLQHREDLLGMFDRLCDA